MQLPFIANLKELQRINLNHPELCIYYRRKPHLITSFLHVIKKNSWHQGVWEKHKDDLFVYCGPFAKKKFDAKKLLYHIVK